MIIHPICLGGLIFARRYGPLFERRRQQAALQDLERRGFDLAPVAAVPIERFVTLASLRTESGTVADASMPITTDFMVDEQTSLAAALKLLTASESYFMTHRDLVTGVVTRADISKPAVALYVLGLILSLERGLDRVIQAHAPDRFLDELSEHRRGIVVRLFEGRQRNNVEIGLVDCLNLDDRLTIVRKSRLHDVCGFQRLKDFNVWKEDLKRLRDQLAHGSAVLDIGSDAVEALAFIADLRERAIGVWSHAEAVEA